MEDTETIERRRIEYLDFTIEVFSSSMSPRDASEELIYLVKKLTPAIKEITGVNAIFDTGQGDEETEDQPTEVKGKNRKR